MARIDAVELHRDVWKYFRPAPKGPFQVFDGSLGMEDPDHFSSYTSLAGIDTLIVKVGTSILAHDEPRRQVYNMQCLSQDLTRLRNRFNVVLITSGAIGLGRKARLRKGERIPKAEESLPQQKRIDAIEGQFLLYELWMHHFYPQSVCECLVTHEDIRGERTSGNLLRKYQRWFERKTIPIVNEDDKKSLEEIDILMQGERVFRDNDSLASLHAQFLRRAGYKPLLILLSNTDGIYTAASFQNHEFEPIRVVKSTDDLESQALPISSSRGRGGVLSKIDAAREAASSGVYTVIANGQYCNHDSPYQDRSPGAKRRYRVLDSILQGDVVGTRFLPVGYAH